MSVLERFHHHITGTPGQPRLVFLHGLMGSAANWRKITSNLNKEFEMLTFDQRGHGRSINPPTGYQPEDYAQDLEALLAELGWDKIFLLGHSMGGRNALMYAHLFPHRINKLIIEDITPEAELKSAERIEFLLGLVPRPFKNRAAAKEFFAKGFVERLKGTANAKTLADYFYTNIEEKDDGTADWRFFLPGILESLHVARDRDYWPEVKALKMPTLIIRGSESKDLDQGDYEKMLQCNPMLQGVVIEGAGHWVHYDQSAAFTEALRSFLKP